MPDTLEDKTKAWEKLMGSPFLLEPSAEISRTRTRLITVGALSLIVGAFNLMIDDTSTVLGLKVHGLNTELVRGCLFFACLYLFVHFSWLILDEFAEWRLRLTGFHEAYKTRSGEEEPGIGRAATRSPRQSTLYSWWAGMVGSPGDALSDVRAALDQVKAYYVGVRRDLDVDQPLHNLLVTLDRQERIFTEGNVPAALRRFDNWFNYFAVRQNLRWLLFDFLAPIIIGAGGLIAISRSCWMPLVESLRTSL